MKENIEGVTYILKCISEQLSELQIKVCVLENEIFEIKAKLPSESFRKINNNWTGKVDNLEKDLLKTKKKQNDERTHI